MMTSNNSSGVQFITQPKMVTKVRVKKRRKVRQLTIATLLAESQKRRDSHLRLASPWLAYNQYTMTQSSAGRDNPYKVTGPITLSSPEHKPKPSLPTTSLSHGRHFDSYLRQETLSSYCTERPITETSPKVSSQRKLRPISKDSQLREVILKTQLKLTNTFRGLNLTQNATKRPKSQQ